MQSMVIEVWVPANCVLTPSLILHNLALQGIRPISEGMTITIDRGHYDCTDTRYAVIVVQTRAPLGTTHPDKWWQCSLFSRKAAPGMDATASYPHWLGNGYMRFGDTAPMCSYRYEAGHAKTWRRTEQPEQPEQPEPERPEPEPEQPEPEPERPEPEQSDAVSVDPVPIPHVSTNKNKNTRIIQLQKKNFMLRTELDALKAEFKDVKADLVGLAQRHKEQEAATRRANQCMQDWANAQLLERVCILEQEQKQPQPQPQLQSCKKIKRIKRCMKRMSERLAFLENKRNDEPISWNPFDFKSIFDHYEEEDDHYLDSNGNNGNNDETECPALDLIEKSPCNNSNNHDNNDNNDNNDNDDDMFEVLQIVPGSEFDFSLSFSLPK
jgi:hypothetical protein